MPLYDLRCTGWEWEDLMPSDATKRCPKCGEKSERMLPCRIHTRYRGSGFYSTDYKKG